MSRESDQSAFPKTVEEKNYPDGGGSYHEPGLTKRQYYAAAALQGLLAAESEGVSTDQVRMDLARDAWNYADALLAAENEAMI